MEKRNSPEKNENVIGEKEKVLVIDDRIGFNGKPRKPLCPEMLREFEKMLACKDIQT